MWEQFVTLVSLDMKYTILKPLRLPEPQKCHQKLESLVIFGLERQKNQHHLLHKHRKGADQPHWDIQSLSTCSYGTRPTRHHLPQFRACVYSELCEDMARLFPLALSLLPWREATYCKELLKTPMITQDRGGSNLPWMLAFSASMQQVAATRTSQACRGKYEGPAVHGDSTDRDQVLNPIPPCQ